MAQAGLSWSTILHRREAYRRAFAHFDPAAVAAFTTNDIERLMGDASIIRNRQKIASTVNTDDSDDKKKRGSGNGPTIVRRTGRVTVILPKAQG